MGASCLIRNRAAAMATRAVAAGRGVLAAVCLLPLALARPLPTSAVLGPLERDIGPLERDIERDLDALSLARVPLANPAGPGATDPTCAEQAPKPTTGAMKGETSCELVKKDELKKIKEPSAAQLRTAGLKKWDPCNHFFRMKMATWGTDTQNKKAGAIRCESNSFLSSAPCGTGSWNFKKWKAGDQYQQCKPGTAGGDAWVSTVYEKALRDQATAMAAARANGYGDKEVQNLKSAAAQVGRIKSKNPLALLEIEQTVTAETDAALSRSRSGAADLLLKKEQELVDRMAKNALNALKAVKPARTANLLKKDHDAANSLPANEAERNRVEAQWLKPTADSDLPFGMAALLAQAPAENWDARAVITAHNKHKEWVGGLQYEGGIIDLDGHDGFLAMGDPHGDLHTFQRLLLGFGIINGLGHWVRASTSSFKPLSSEFSGQVGGNRVVAVHGDLADRGADLKGLLELIRRLQVEAYAEGGLFLLVLGNHDAYFTRLHGLKLRIRAVANDSHLCWQWTRARRFHATSITCSRCMTRTAISRSTWQRRTTRASAARTHGKRRSNQTVALSETGGSSSLWCCGSSFQPRKPATYSAMPVSRNATSKD